jgi:hypothetical protein
LAEEPDRLDRKVVLFRDHVAEYLGETETKLVRERADLMFGRLALRPSGAEHLSIFHQDDPARSPPVVP